MIRVFPDSMAQEVQTGRLYFIFNISILNIQKSIINIQYQIFQYSISGANMLPTFDPTLEAKE